jgi:hypothetical protein
MPWPSPPVSRPHRVEEVLAAWRRASRARLAKVHRLDLVLVRACGIEVDDLAAAHNVPADLLWDLIAGEFARLDIRRVLTVQVLSGWRTNQPADRLACTGRVCLYGCARTCTLTLPDLNQSQNHPVSSPGPGTPGHAARTSATGSLSTTTGP